MSLDGPLKSTESADHESASRTFNSLDGTASEAQTPHLSLCAGQSAN